MPTYDYQCQKCGFEFEREQRITEDPIKTCPKCKSRKAKRLLSAPNFILKGGGWYADGYGSSGSSKSGKDGGDSSGGSGGDSSKDSSASQSDSKSEGKSESKSSSATGDGAKGSKSSGDSKPSGKSAA